MQKDTITYDTLNARPVPKWLIDQKEGLTAIQPEKIVIHEDNSLKISFTLTAVIILVSITILTIIILKKFRTREK